MSLTPVSAKENDFPSFRCETLLFQTFNLSGFHEPDAKPRRNRDAPMA